MSSISNITSSTISLATATPLTPITSAAADNADNAEATGDTGGAQGGYVIEAISKTLSLDIISSDSGAGVKSNADTSEANTTGNDADTAQALGSFIQSLLAALQEQSDAGDDASDAVSGTAAGDGSRSPLPAQMNAGGPGKFESDLQNLISELRNAGNAGSGDNAELEASFKNLLSALGDADSGTTLNDFLANLQSNMQSGPTAVGGVVNTRA